MDGGTILPGNVDVSLEGRQIEDTFFLAHSLLITQALLKNHLGSQVFLFDRPAGAGPRDTGEEHHPLFC